MMTINTVYVRTKCMWKISVIFFPLPFLQIAHEHPKLKMARHACNLQTMEFSLIKKKLYYINVLKKNIFKNKVYKCY